MSQKCQEILISFVEPFLATKSVFVDDQGAGAPPVSGQTARVEVDQPGEEEAAKRPYRRLPVPKRGLQERWGGTLCQGV